MKSCQVPPPPRLLSFYMLQNPCRTVSEQSPHRLFLNMDLCAVEKAVKHIINKQTMWFRSAPRCPTRRSGVRSFLCPQHKCANTWKLMPWWDGRGLLCIYCMHANAGAVSPMVIKLQFLYLQSTLPSLFQDGYYFARCASLENNVSVIKTNSLDPFYLAGFCSVNFLVQWLFWI